MAADLLVRIHLGHVTLEGNLTLPAKPAGVVLFAHGSGSSRHSPRNRFVAEQLQRAGFTTLLMDLLTADEEIVDRATARLRFDIALLAERLVYATRWLQARSKPEAAHLGYFGASTGAAAALVAAANRPELIEAIVSRGGRPDLAGPLLPAVRAPALLIVGELDDVVIELNRRAAAEMRAPHKIRIVPGATHLFEEPGALEEVAALAREWFEDHLMKSNIDVS